MILPDFIPRFFPHFIFFFQRLFPDSICPFLLVAFIRDVGYWRLLPCVSGLFCPQGLLVRRKTTASPSTKLWFLYHFTKGVFFTLQAFCDSSKSSETLLSIWSRVETIYFVQKYVSGKNSVRSPMIRQISNNIAKVKTFLSQLKNSYLDCKTEIPLGLCVDRYLGDQLQFVAHRGRCRGHLCIFQSKLFEATTCSSLFRSEYNNLPSSFKRAALGSFKALRRKMRSYILQEGERRRRSKGC